MFNSQIRSQPSRCVLRLSTATFLFLVILLDLAGCERRDWQASQTEQAARQPSESGRKPSARVETRKSESVIAKAPANDAVSLQIFASNEQDQLAGTTATASSTFLVLDTRWENTHPKQKVSKDKLEGKTDRTMGVGGLNSGGSSKPVEYVEMDVAYMVPKLSGTEVKRSYLRAGRRPGDRPAPRHSETARRVQTGCILQHCQTGRSQRTTTGLPDSG